MAHFGKKSECSVVPPFDSSPRGRFKGLLEQGESSKILKSQPVKICRSSPNSGNPSAQEDEAILNRSICPFGYSLDHRQGGAPLQCYDDVVPSEVGIMQGTNSHLGRSELFNRGLIPFDGPFVEESSPDNLIQDQSPIDRSFVPSIGEKVKLGKQQSSSQALVVAVEHENPLSEVSLWVLEKMENVSTYMGMSFVRVERQSWEFFPSGKVQLEAYRLKRDRSIGM